MFNPFQLMPLFNQFRQNPVAFLMSRNLNIPPEYMQTPEMASKYLISHSNMSQDQINNLMSTANQFQGMINGNTQGKNSQG